jgi:hypothetical protein
MLPSIPLGLGDALRRRFHPEVPGNVWGRLDALPGTRRDVEGWHLADHVQDVLRAGFFAQRTISEARQVLGFVSEQIETAGRFVPADSLARFACEGLLLRLSILAGDAPDAGESPS